MVLIKENVIVGSKAQQTTYYWRGTRKYWHPLENTEKYSQGRP